MINRKVMAALLAAGVLILSLPLAACDERSPAEKVGDSINEAGKDIGRAIEDAAD
jgi:hypothetical protein